MDLSSFTKRIEECRKRWNRRTLQYVVAFARIALKARKAAGSHRRWSHWIRSELRMGRSTIHRYLRVEAFLRRNVAARIHFENLSIHRIYALSKVPPKRASAILRSASALRMSDRPFLRMLRRMSPRKHRKLNPSNLLSTMNAALGRIEHAIRRWRSSAALIQDSDRTRLRTRLLAAEKDLHRIARSAAAM